MRAIFQRMGLQPGSKQGAGTVGVTAFPSDRERKDALVRRESDHFSEQIKAGVRFATRSYIGRINESRAPAAGKVTDGKSKDYAASA